MVKMVVLRDEWLGEAELKGFSAGEALQGASHPPT